MSRPPEARVPPRSPRERLLAGIDALPQDWASRIGDFIDAYTGTADRPNSFCGREQDVEALRGWLSRPNAPPNLLVTAPAGRGKSALLVRFAVELAGRENVAVAFMPLSLRFDTQRPDVFLGCLVARLAFLHGREPPDLRHTSVDILQGMLRDDLTRPLPDGRATVILLDGLDEATGWSLRPGLLPAQHQGSIRIIVSARHQPDDLEGVKWLRQLGWERPRHAERMLLPLLEAWDVEVALGRLAAPLDRLSQRPELVSELTRLCAGEPLTLWLMIEDLRDAGEAALEMDISGLRSREPGLASWFERWWDHQRKQWGDAARLREPAVRALLNLLAVADGGLTREDVLELARAEIPDSFTLDEALRTLSRLIHGDGKNTGYVPAHPGFAQHLREQLTAAERRAWRGRLLAWSRRVVDDYLQGLRPAGEVPRYVVHNRAGHLHEEAVAPDPWMSLATRAWYDAWQAHETGPSGFLGQLEDAWRAVAGSDVARLPDEARCALIRGSIGSEIAHVAPDLLHGVLEHGVWSPEQALAYIREAPLQELSHDNPARLVTTLIPYIPAALLPQLFKVAHELNEKSQGRTQEALEQLLPKMAEAAPSEAITTLRQTRSEWTRAWLLIVLAAHLPAPRRASVLAEAHDLASRATSQVGRVRLLKELAKLLPEPERERVLLDALATAREIADFEQRSYAITELASELPADLQASAGAEALAAVAHLEDDKRYFRILHLVERLPSSGRDQALCAAVAEIRAIEEPSAAVQGWRNLLESLPSEEHLAYLDDAFESVRRVTDEAKRCMAVENLLHELGRVAKPDGSRQERAARALRVAQDFEHPWYRVRVLTSLMDSFPSEVLWPMAKQAWPAVEEAVRGDDSLEVSHLLSHLMWIAPIEIALDAARHAKFAWLRAELLTVIARRLPPEASQALVDEALEAALAVETPRKRAQLFHSIWHQAAPAQEDAVFAALCQATEEIPDPYWRSIAWARLARCLAQPWRTAALDIALASTCAIERAHPRLHQLREIIAIAEDDRRGALLDEAVVTARQLPHRGELLARELTGLAQAASGPRRVEMLRAALDATRELDDGKARVDAMAAYGAHLPPEEIGALVACIDDLRLTGDRVRSYVLLLERCPAVRAQLFDRALTAARTPDRESPPLETRTSFLVQLIEVAPQSAREALLREVLDTARRDLASAERTPPATFVEEEYPDMVGAMVDQSVASALTRAAPHLPAAWILEALQIARGIPTIMHRAHATVALADRLDQAGRTRCAEEILALELPLGLHSSPARTRSQLAHTVAPLLPEPRRGEVLAAFPSASPTRQALNPNFSDSVLLEHIDRQIASKEGFPLPLSWLLPRMPAERRARVVDHVLERVPGLAPHLQASLLAQLLPYVPDSWVDRCLATAKERGVSGAHEGFRMAAGRLDDRQLDLALALLEADGSRAHPQDPRLEALAAVAAERLRRPDPPRAMLRQLVHDTLHRRAETRAAALIALSALAPLVVELGGAAAAVGVVRAIRQVGTWWP